MPTLLLTRYGCALLYVSFMLLSWCSAAVTLASEQQPLHREQTLLEFDIPAQPLETALQEYTEVTGLNVLLDRSLIADQHSPGAQGSFTAQQALQQLIVHSGLDAQYASSRTFTLRPRTQQQPKPAQPVPPVALHVSQRVTAFQRTLERAICHSDVLPEGNYRMLIQAWLSPQGSVDALRLVKQTDDSQRDKQVLDALRSLTFPPSSGSMPQPITLLLLPANISNGCSA